MVKQVMGEIYLSQAEEEYKFENLLISPLPKYFSIAGLKTSLIMVRGFLFLKNL